MMTNMTKMNTKKTATNKNLSLAKELKLAIEMALEAGQILLAYQKKLTSLKITYKDAFGVASTADLKSEAYIRKEIKKNFPHHAILSEEDAFLRQEFKFEHDRQQEFNWVVDPLDGTNNFLCGHDYFCVSIALTYRGQSVLGVIFRPTTGELFTAIKGQGAYYQKLSKNYKTSKKIKLGQLTNKKPLVDAVIVMGSYKTSDQKFLQKEFKCYQYFSQNCRGIRRMGSAALDLSYVAKGVFDGQWEYGLQPWDVAAAGLICQESGAQVTNFSGQIFHPYQGSILAARKPMHETIKKLLQQYGMEY